MPGEAPDLTKLRSCRSKKGEQAGNEVKAAYLRALLIGYTRSEAAAKVGVRQQTDQRLALQRP